MLVGLLTYTEYGTRLPIKVCSRPAQGILRSTVSVAQSGISGASGSEPAPGMIARTDYIFFLHTAQLLAWSAVAVVSTLIVASRKHYSVDVVIAWCANARPASGKRALMLGRATFDVMPCRVLSPLRFLLKRCLIM